MPDTQDYFKAALSNVVEIEKRIVRHKNVIGHLKMRGQPTETAEAELSKFHLMSRLYRERRDQLEMLLKKST